MTAFSQRRLSESFATAFAPLVPYGVAVASVALAIWVRLLLDPWLLDSSQFVTLFAAVMLTAWYGGLGPTLVALACGSLAAIYFVLEPRHTFALGRLPNQLGLSLYAIVGLASALLFESLRNARARSEERSRRFSQAVLDILPFHLAVLDGAGSIVAVNEAWRRFAVENGGTPATWVGANYLDIAERAHGPGSEEAMQAAAGIRAILSGASTSFLLEYPCSSPDERRWFLMAAVPLDLDTGHCVVAHVDITDRKLAEERVRTDEELLRTAFGAARMGWWEWNVADDRILWSPEVAELFGTPPTNFGNTYEGFLNLLHPDDRDRAAQRVRAAVENGEPYEIEFRTVRPDGSVRWALARGRVLRDAEGRPTKMLGVDMDITPRKEAEEGLRRSEEELRRIDRNRNVFLATLGHELRNPLAAIRNAVAVLKTRADDHALAEQMRALIDRQSAHMAYLLEDLLDVSRIGQGKIELRKKQLNLAALVRDAADMVRPLVDASSHELTTAFPDEPVDVEADPTRLKQVVANLLTNAVKYTPEGGRIDLRVERDGGDAVLRVTDNGLGIPAEVLPRIFDVYAQAAQHADRSRGGLGLGLTLVKRLVEMHDGSVEARSAGLGKGSTFTVRLPAASATSGVGSWGGAPRPAQ